MIRSYSTVLFWLGMTIASSLMLYQTSDKVHALDKQLRDLNAQIEDEQKSIHVLKAEWVYLSNPARIETKAKKHLGLKLTEPARVAALCDINDFVPMQEGVPAPVLLARSMAKAPAPVTAEPKKPLMAQKAPDKPRTKQDRILASLNAGRINDHVTIQRAASAAPSDNLSAVIGRLGLRP